MFQHHRNHVFAEIQVRVGFLPLQQHFNQFPGREDVVAHGGETGLPPRDPFRDLGFFGKTGDPRRFIYSKNPVTPRFLKGHFKRGNGDVGLVHLVEFDHLGHVHLVNMVATKDCDIIRIRRFNKAQVLEDCIGRPLEPLLAFTAGLRGNTDKKISQACPLPPGFPQMLVQRIGPVLGEDINLLDTGIEQVGENKVDDLVFPAESDTRLGPTQGERAEPFPLTTGQHHRNSLTTDISHRTHR